MAPGSLSFLTVSVLCEEHSSAWLITKMKMTHIWSTPLTLPR